MRTVSESPAQRPHPSDRLRASLPVLPAPVSVACARDRSSLSLLPRMSLCAVACRRLTDCLSRDGSPLVLAVESLQLRSATAAATATTTAAVTTAAAA